MKLRDKNGNWLQKMMYWIFHKLDNAHGLLGVFASYMFLGHPCLCILYSVLFFWYEQHERTVMRQDRLDMVQTRDKGWPEMKSFLFYLTPCFLGIASFLIFTGRGLI